MRFVFLVAERCVMAHTPHIGPNLPKHYSIGSQLPPQPGADVSDYVATSPNFYTVPTIGEALECIEPRRIDRDLQGTALQTPGGEAGKAQDESLARTVLEDQFVSMEDVLAEPVPEGCGRTGCTHSGHCTFLGIRVPLLQRVATESGSIARIVHDGQWMGYYASVHEIGMGDMATAANAIIRAAVPQYEQSAGTSQPEVIKMISDKYPGRRNVLPVVGEAPTANVYVTNHGFGSRLDRDEVHAAGVQIFHDNLGAIVAEGVLAARERGLKGADVALYVAAPVMRTAATLDEINALRGASNKVALRHYQVTPGRRGAQTFSREFY